MGNTIWNVKHATLSYFEERRREVCVLDEIPQTCLSALRYDEK